MGINRSGYYKWKSRQGKLNRYEQDRILLTQLLHLGKVGAKALLLIVGALAFRMLGVFVCLLGTSLSKKERLFAMMAYTPKATVQAAIGGIPLALGFACGDTVLTVAVLAIVLTAPLGAFAMDLSYKKLLKKG